MEEAQAARREEAWKRRRQRAVAASAARATFVDFDVFGIFASSWVQQLGTMAAASGGGIPWRPAT